MTDANKNKSPVSPTERLSERATKASASMQQEIKDLLDLAQVAPDAQKQQALGAAAMVTEWMRVVDTQGEALAARDTLFQHVRLTLVQALTMAQEKIEKGAAPHLILADFAATLDLALPPRRKGK